MGEREEGKVREKRREREEERELEDKRIGKGEGKIGNQAEKWEGGEGNQVGGNIIHPCKKKGTEMNNA